MEITGVRAQLLDVNCYALAGGDGSAGSPCVLVDAGFDCAEDLERVLADVGWEPVAIILTHGHADHVLGLPNLLAKYPVPTYLGRPDLYRLVDPTAGVSPQFAQALTPLAAEWTAPDVTAVDDGDVLELAGLTFTATLAPGHTEGSVLFAVEDRAPAGDGPTAVLMSGDVLFAGSVGRTDLPGGDPAAMERSLQALKSREDTPVLPGHGPASTLAHELATNPFL